MPHMAALNPKDVGYGSIENIEKICLSSGDMKTTKLRLRMRWTILQIVACTKTSCKLNLSN